MRRLPEVGLLLGGLCCWEVLCCWEAAFVHKQGIFCGCGEEIVLACPHRGCLVWTEGAKRVHFCWFCAHPLPFRCSGHNLLPQRAHFGAGGHTLVHVGTLCYVSVSIRSFSAAPGKSVIILYGRRILLGVPEYILLRLHHAFGRDSIYI